MGKTKNLIGKRFGKLVVTEFAGTNKFNKATWVCICDCGRKKQKNPSTGDLISGKVKSCGCTRVEENKKAKNRKHGMYKTRLYRIWEGMKQRCKLNLKSYEKIEVCEEWKSFQSFSKWALANGYTDNLTIDRINNFGNYEPTNCRWASAKEQQNNKRNNRIVSFHNRNMTVSQFSELVGIPKWKAKYQLDKGMTPEQIAEQILKKEM